MTIYLCSKIIIGAMLLSGFWYLEGAEWLCEHFALLIIPCSRLILFKTIYVCSYSHYRTPTQFNLNIFFQAFWKKPVVNYIEFDKIQVNTPRKIETQGKTTKMLLKQTLKQALSSIKHTPIFKISPYFKIFEVLSLHTKKHGSV